MSKMADCVLLKKSDKASSKMSRPGVMSYEKTKELISLPDKDYIPPELPFRRVKFEQEIEFGSDRMRKQFCIDFSNWTFINHGAFGGALSAAIETVSQIQLHSESQPLRFVDRELLPNMVYVIRRLADFISCDPRDLVLVSNATEATATIVKSLNLRSRDRVYYLNTRYYAVNKLLMFLKDDIGIEVQEEIIPSPSTEQEILDIIATTLQLGTKLAIFDHIPSVHPIVMPVDKIINICHSKGVEVLIDGAHALGALPLDIGSLGADYYVINCHKWLCNAKGCAALYVDKKHQSKIRCLTVSGGFGKGFTPEFIFRSLKDYSPFLALHTALDFWLTLGPDKIRTYITTLAHKAAKMLSSEWKTDTLFPINMYGPMVLVRLPDILWKRTGSNLATKPIADDVQDDLHYDYGIEVPVKSINGRLYVRISAHVYNRMRDFESLSVSVCQMVESIKEKTKLETFEKT